MRRQTGIAAALVFLLGASMVAGAEPQELQPGASVILTCPGGFAEISIIENREATLTCTPLTATLEPSPSVAPSASSAQATPSMTALPTPTPVPATPAPTVAPTPSTTVAPIPTPATGANVSGIHVPTPFSGYERVHFTEFPNAQALGDPPHPDTAQYLQPRPDADRDCTYNDSSGRGKYCWRATTSEHNGVLDMWLHTETGSCKTSGFTKQHNGNGGCNYVAGPKWTLPNQDDFVISYVAKLDDIPGRKVAFLRWCGPKIGTAGYCEDNFVEAKLEPGPRGNAFHHHESRSTQQGKQLNIELDEWHLYQMHVKPGQFVDFYLDGELVLRATQYVSTNDSYWVFQAETYLGGQSIPVPHNQGHLFLDSYAVDLPAS